MHALEAGDDRNLLAFLEPPLQFTAVNAENARRAMDVRRFDRKLPALPGPCIDVEILQRDRHQAGRHLLACRDHGIVFPGIKICRSLRAAEHQATN